MRALRYFGLSAFALMMVGLCLAQPDLPVALSDDDDGHEEEEHHDESPLELSMELLQANLRLLKDQVADPEARDSSVELVMEMQFAVLTAKQHVPKTIQQAEEGEQPALRVEYCKQLNTALAELMALEESLLDGNHEAGPDHLRALVGIMKGGHDRFKGGD